MLAHVDSLEGFFRGGEGSLDDVLWPADEGEDGPVGGRPGVDVQEFDARDGGDGRGDGINNLKNGVGRPLCFFMGNHDHLLVSSFREIRDAFNDFGHF